MKTRSLLIAGTIGMLISFGASAQCVAPDPPSDPPSGATATRDEMLAAQAAIKKHNAAVTAFSDCVRRSGINELRADEAVRHLEKLAEKFNAELRAFKQRSGG